jgi:hypothetical protein
MKGKWRLYWAIQRYHEQHRDEGGTFGVRIATTLTATTRTAWGTVIYRVFGVLHRALPASSARDVPQDDRLAVNEEA